MPRTWCVTALVMALSAAAVAQRTTRPRRADPPDPRIAAALKEVSPARIRGNIEKLASFGTRHTLSTTSDARRGIGAAREWIRAEFERYSQACGGCLEVEMQRFTAPAADRIPQPAEIVNVVATLRGREQPQRVYLVSGHYDSRNSDPMDARGDAPGANDDGSGTAVVLETARVLSKLKLPGTIVFAAFAGEEQGLNGSEHFAKTAHEQGLDVEAVLNNDIVGGDRGRQQDPGIVRVFSEGVPASASPEEVKRIRGLGAENDSPSRQLARYIRETARLYLPGRFGPKLVFRPDRYLRGGDHTSFNRHGYAAVRFTEYREDFNHQHQNPRMENGIEYGDLPKFVDAEYAANVARLNAAVLASLAAAPAPPGKVRLLARDLENDSTLLWEAAPGASGYEVLVRATDDAEWQPLFTEAVGNVTRATVRRSKDNVAFAVRSLDRQGHRSLAVVPTPER